MFRYLIFYEAERVVFVSLWARGLHDHFLECNFTKDLIYVCQQYILHYKLYILIN